MRNANHSTQDMAMSTKKIAVPSEGIKGARTSPSDNSSVIVTFTEPFDALRFANAVRVQIMPTKTSHHHLIINEQVGNANYAHHFALVVSDGSDPAAYADYVAATLNGRNVSMTLRHYLS